MRADIISSQASQNPGCESQPCAKSLNRPGMVRPLSLVDAGAIGVVIVAKLDRLTRSVKDLAELLERFNRRGVSLVSVAESSLDTGTGAGRLRLPSDSQTVFDHSDNPIGAIAMRTLSAALEGAICCW